MDAKDKQEIKRIKDALTESITAFCRTHLDEDYEGLCIRLIEKMSRKRVVPFLSGRSEIWAAAIVYAIGSINFLFDKTFKPYVTTNELCEYFNTKNSSVTQKAKLIRDMFKMDSFDPEFSTKYMQEQNPFNDFVMLNGFIVPKNMLPGNTTGNRGQI